jgi:hypothetical protein
VAALEARVDPGTGFSICAPPGVDDADGLGVALGVELGDGEGVEVGVGDGFGEGVAVGVGVDVDELNAL